MANLLEMAAEIVAAHASVTTMNKEELVAEIASVYQALASLEKGEAVPAESVGEAAGPVVPKKKAFGKDKVYCMICGKAMKTLTRHLKTAHELKPGQYRKQFGIPSSQSLAAKSYSESRRQMAIEKGLGAGLAKARAARTANVAASKAKTTLKAKAAKKK